MKRLSLFLIILSIGLSLCACAPRPSSKTPSAPATDDSLAVVTVYAYEPKNEPTYGLLYLGHAFLSFENRSSEPVVLGAITLEAGQSCSLGTWSMSHHFGVWYNIESNYIEAAQKYGGRVSFTKEMPIEAFETVSAYIAEHDVWSLFTNCARFAADIFDSIDGDKIELNGLATPTRLADRIRAFDAHEIDRPITHYGKTGFADPSGRFEEYEYAA